MRRSKGIKDSRPSFAVVVDGKDEIWYLQMLHRNEPDINVKIKPEIPNKKSIEDRFTLVRDLSGFLSGFLGAV